MISEFLKLQRYAEKVEVNDDANGAVVIDLSLAPVHDLTLTGNVTSLTFQGFNTESNLSHTVTVYIRQDGVGGYTVNFAGTQWTNGTPPIVTPTASAKDIYVLTTIDNGGTFQGAIAGQDIS